MILLQLNSIIVLASLLFSVKNRKERVELVFMRTLYCQCFVINFSIGFFPLLCELILPGLGLECSLASKSLYVFIEGFKHFVAFYIPGEITNTLQFRACLSVLNVRGHTLVFIIASAMWSSRGGQLCLGCFPP